MPVQSLRPCRSCRKATRNANGYCDSHQDQRRALVRQASAIRNDSPIQKLYARKEWKSLRLRQLRQQPLCQFCMGDKRVTLATICDHIRPHRGDESLFFDPANLQSLCKRCHDSTKQRIERQQGGA